MCVFRGGLHNITLAFRFDQQREPDYYMKLQKFFSWTESVHCTSIIWSGVVIFLFLESLLFQILFCTSFFQNKNSSFEVSLVLQLKCQWTETLILIGCSARIIEFQSSSISFASALEGIMKALDIRESLQGSSKG